MILEEKRFGITATRIGCLKAIQCWKYNFGITATTKTFFLSNTDLVLLKQQLFFFKGNAILVLPFGMIYWIYNFGHTPGNKVYKCKYMLSKGSETRMLK